MVTKKKPNNTHSKCNRKWYNTYAHIPLSHSNIHFKYFVYYDVYPKVISKLRGNLLVNLDPFRFVDNSIHIRKGTIHIQLHMFRQSAFATFDPESNERTSI